ncbi:MAG TPA: GIY-YIG nuclease family protein [bacterium]|nr:GIY-YIG nuclease family protein [bacterium]
MSYYVYILQSESTGRYYCGSTADLADRIARHNNPKYHGTQTTKRFPGPWGLVWSIEQPTRGDAIILEMKIKKRGIRRYLIENNSFGV